MMSARHSLGDGDGDDGDGVDGDEPATPFYVSVSSIYQQFPAV